MAPEPAANKIGKTVGERLRAARIAQNYTQGQLAAPDFSVSYISAIERGQIHPSLRALEILSTRLGLSSTQLLPNRVQQDDHHAAPLIQPERDNDENDLILLEIQVLLRQRDGAQAFAKLEKIPLKRLKQSQQLQHTYFTGWAAFLLNNLEASEYILNNLVQKTKDEEESYLNTHLLYLLGIVYAVLHKYEQALLVHQRCLNILKSATPQDAFFIAQVSMHLGNHYLETGDAEQAQQTFKDALEATNSFTSAKQKQQFYLGLSEHYADDKRFDLATIYGYKSLSLHNETSRKKQRSVLYHALGQALLKQEPAQAMAQLDETLRQDSVQQDALAQASLYLRKAQLYFSEHQLYEALDCAQEAHQLAKTYTDSPITAEILLTLGRIEYAQEEYAEGDVHFVEGLAILEQVGSQNELAEQSVRYAQLLENRGNEREAFTYFRRAFQTSQRSR